MSRVSSVYALGVWRGLLTSSGRYAVVLVGLVGLFTSVHIACTFDRPPPEKKGRDASTPMTVPGNDSDAAPSNIVDSSTGEDSGGGGYYGYGVYGYGYDPQSCTYGYGYSYYSAYGDCD